MKIMELINKFENETDGTVKDFNELFQLPLKFDENLEVEIGEIRGPETRREVKYRDWETDRKSTRLNSSHSAKSRMPSSA